MGTRWVTLALFGAAVAWAQDPREIVRRSIAQDQLDWTRLKDYIWQEYSLERHFDSRGNVAIHQARKMGNSDSGRAERIVACWNGTEGSGCQGSEEGGSSDGLILAPDASLCEPTPSSQDSGRSQSTHKALPVFSRAFVDRVLAVFGL